MSDGPLLEIVKQANAVIDKGGVTFQKFTCSNCGARETMSVPDTFYESGICEECGFETDIKENGCGFMVVMTKNREEVKKLLEDVENFNTVKEHLYYDA